MTGYHEAAAWLKANAPEWQIAHSETRLKAGNAIGAPTEQWVAITLARHDASPVWLSGEGVTILDATQRAIDGLR